jgi:hypothetical protein
MQAKGLRARSEVRRFKGDKISMAYTLDLPKESCHLTLQKQDLLSSHFSSKMTQRTMLAREFLLPTECPQGNNLSPHI